MNARTFAQLLTVFVLGLFVGSNLGVMLMCLLMINAPDVDREECPAVQA